MKLGLESLERRISAASLGYAIDVIGDDGTQLDVPDARAVEVGELLTVDVKVRANYEEGELPFGKVGGPFAGGVHHCRSSVHQRGLD